MASSLRAKVLVLSDAASRGAREDLSGPAIRTLLEEYGWRVDSVEILPDNFETIRDRLKILTAAGDCDAVFTSGGTGVGPNDVTPEATRAVCDRLLDGVAEVMRAAGREETPLAALGRGVCGTLGESGERTALLLNLPGNPAGAVTSLRAVAPLLGHALDLLAGKARHGGDEG